MPTEVIPTNDHDDLYPPGRSAENEAYLDELVRKKGVKPIHDVSSMAIPWLFDSDEEHEEFLRWLREERNRDLA